MNITNFKNFRINNSENFVDVKSFNGHSNDGVMLVAHDFTSKIQIRRREAETAMFVSSMEEFQIPEHWADAEVIFKNY